MDDQESRSSYSNLMTIFMTQNPLTEQEAILPDMVICNTTGIPLVLLQLGKGGNPSILRTLEHRTQADIVTVGGLWELDNKWNIG